LPGRWPSSSCRVRDPGGFFVTILTGVVGAMAGGFISTKLGFGGVTGLNLPGLIIAVAGSVLLLAVFRALRRS
jgi:uncharacterized membrane protein YeaQ/YmgE (transglycosylase-associated protein family)